MTIIQFLFAFIASFVGEHVGNAQLEDLRLQVAAKYDAAEGPLVPKAKAFFDNVFVRLFLALIYPFAAKKADDYLNSPSEWEIKQQEYEYEQEHK